MSKAVLVTGANAGIGKAAALAIARRGHRVLMVCRSRKRGDEARQEIARRTSGPVPDLFLCDLSSQRQVRELAAQVVERYERLDVLLNNAAVFARRRRTTEDGIELQLAVNHLAPFLLTNLLRPLLEASAPARVVTVSSEAHRRGGFRFDDPGLEGGYGGKVAYGQSKLANILFTRELAQRLEATGVTANACHPGVVATRLLTGISFLARFARLFLRTPEEGARTPVYLALSSEVEGVTGEYFVDEKVRLPSEAARDPEAARRLWELSAELTGLDPSRADPAPAAGPGSP